LRWRQSCVPFFFIVAESGAGGSHGLTVDAVRVDSGDPYDLQLSSSILAMICASLSRRSGESCPVRATQLGRPSEFSAAFVMFVLLSDGISEASANGMLWNSRRLRSAPFR
jgi:hypothetical protein